MLAENGEQFVRWGRSRTWRIDSERADGAGNQHFVPRGFARLAGDFYAAMIQLGDAVGQSELREFVAIRAECIGLNDLRARFDIGLMDAEDGFGCDEFSSSMRALRADGFVEQRAHRAVGDEHGVLEALVEIFNSHG